MTEKLKKQLAKSETHTEKVFEHIGSFQFLRIEHRHGPYTTPPGPANPDFAFVQVYCLTPTSNDSLGLHNVMTFNSKQCREIGAALLRFADNLDVANAQADNADAS